MKIKQLVALLLALALLAVACGSDDAGDSDAATDDAPVAENDTSVDDEPAAEDDGDDESASGATSTAGAATGSAGLDISTILAADLNDCADAPTGEAIKVGMAMDFSDVVGFVDIPGSKLVPYVAQKINCSGGIDGSPVEVRVAEVGDDAALAGQDLLDWGAHFLIGPPFADFALPILQVTEGNVPMFVAASTEPTLADASINSYLVTFDDFGMSEAAAQWAFEQGITRAIVFTEGEGIPYTGVNPDAFAAEFAALGGEVVSTQTYVWAADTDFSSQVNEIAGISENNEVVFSAALGFQLTALRGQLEGQGLDGLTYIGTDALDATGIQFEDNNEGIAHTPHTSIAPGDPIDTLLADFARDEGEELESRGFMALYVDSMFLGIQGIIDCSCTEPTGIGDAVKEISGFQGLSGEITYAGTNGIPPKAVPINQILDSTDTLVAVVGEGGVAATGAGGGAQSGSTAGSATGSAGLDIASILNADLDNCAEAPTGEAIKVGMAMDFSDVVGFVDIPGSNLVPFVAELANCNGGINGSPVEVRVAEVGDDAALAAQDLLDWGAHFLIGPPFADFALPILQETGGEVPMFVAASTEPTLADASINSYLVTFDDFGMSEAAAQWAFNQGITRAIVFTEGEGIPYTGVNPDAFAAKFTELGGEVVSTQTYVWAADTDFSSQVNEIAGISENNEVVFSAALGFQLTALRGQLEGQGLDGLTYIGTDALDATGIQFEDNNEGIAHTPHTSIAPGDPIDSLLERYEAEQGEALESRGFMALYVDSMFLGIQGIIDCGCTEPSGIGDAISEISGFQGLSGEITYAGTNGIPPKAVPINQIVDGTDTLVDVIGG